MSPSFLRNNLLSKLRIHLARKPNLRVDATRRGIEKNYTNEALCEPATRDKLKKSENGGRGTEDGIFSFLAHDPA